MNFFEIWSFIARDNARAANRVIDAVYETLNCTVINPRIGRLRRFKNPRLKEIRSIAVAGFDKYVVFYRIVPAGGEVIHVYHGARNIDALFDDK